MRTIRLAIAALIGMALAILPISANLAAPPAAQVEMQGEMCAGADDTACFCCHETQLRGAGVCNLKCCSAIAIPVERSQTGPRAQTVTDMTAATLSPFLAQPDPPPPRS